MYSVRNVEKFLDDKGTSVGKRKKALVLKRAREQGGADGVLLGGNAKELWKDRALQEEFERLIGTDPVHMEIGVTAIRAAHADKSAPAP